MEEQVKNLVLEELYPDAPEPLSDDAVTRHTTGLWKYLPVPSEEPDPFPEYLTRDAALAGCLFHVIPAPPGGTMWVIPSSGMKVMRSKKLASA